MSTTSPTIILASGSTYKRALLERLGLDFKTLAPALDETHLAGETGRQTAARLAREKARACTQAEAEALVIGADQVALLNEEIIGKPHTHQRATEQLCAASGQRVVFFTAVYLVDQSSEREWHSVDETVVYFRPLDMAEIESYLHREQPYDCAGSFKSEGLGISLFNAIETRDPSALIGLPLIALARFLREASISIL